MRKVYDDNDDDGQQTNYKFPWKKTKENVINKKFDAFGVDYGIISLVRQDCVS